VNLLKIIFTSVFICIAGCFFSQPNYGFTITTTTEICQKAYALLAITGTVQADSVAINWSTGQKNTTQLINLTGGEYSVHIKIKHKDTIVHVTDTVIHFTVEKELCVVLVAKHFSPNDDGYNDRLQIANVLNYPNFELFIYNRWGQRVHHQKKDYIAWDGKWLGSDLPDGTYFYMFFYDASDRDKFEKGDITILR
jgi:gliding motility-associated-like protein